MKFEIFKNTSVKKTVNLFYCCCCCCCCCSSSNEIWDFQKYISKKDCESFLMLLLSLLLLLLL